MSNPNMIKKYVPNANMQEVFADGIQFIMFDGSNVRFELTINRPLDNPPPGGGGRQGGGGGQGGGQPPGARHPAARLILPLHVVAELSKHFSKVLADLEQRGIKPGQQGRVPGGGGPGGGRGPGGPGRGPGGQGRPEPENELGYYGPPPGQGQN